MRSATGAPPDDGRRSVRPPGGEQLPLHCARGPPAAQARLEQQIATQPVGSPERASLQQSVQRLDALRAVASGGAYIIGRATATSSPSGMRLSTALIIGFLIGSALAFSLVFALESL